MRACVAINHYSRSKRVSIRVLRTEVDVTIHPDTHDAATDRPGERHRERR
jgi:hypothetical protein